MPPAADNPKGFWEHKGIVDCHTDLLNEIDSYYDDFFPLPDGWQNQPKVKPHRSRLFGILKDEFAGKPLWGFKDPRACRLMGLWQGLLEEFRADGRYVLMARHPAEVGASLATRGGEAWNKALLMYLGHTLDAERDTRGRRRVVVTYDQLMGDWRATAARIAEALELKWTHEPGAAAGAFSEFLDPTLRHHVGASARNDDWATSHGIDPRIARWATGAYDVLARAADGGAIDQAALDAIADEFASARPLLAGWRPTWSMNERYLQMGEWAQKMHWEMKRLADENQKLRMELGHRPTVLEAVARRAEAEARAAGAEDRAADAEARASQAQLLTAAAEAHVREVLGRLAERQMVAANAQTRASVAESRAAAAEQSLADLRHSLSWEITGPLRAAGGLANRLLGKSPKRQG